MSKLTWDRLRTYPKFVNRRAPCKPCLTLQTNVLSASLPNLPMWCDNTGHYSCFRASPSDQECLLHTELPGPSYRAALSLSFPILSVNIRIKNLVMLSPLGLPSIKICMYSRKDFLRLLEELAQTLRIG